MNERDFGEQLDDDIDALSEDEAMEMIRNMLAEHNVILESEFELGGHTFTIESVDHGGTESANRATGRDDLLTRQLSSQREILKRAIKKIDGRPIEPRVLERVIRTAPPALVARLYSEFHALRTAQDIGVGNMVALVKK